MSTTYSTLDRAAREELLSKLFTLKNEPYQVYKPFAHLFNRELPLNTVFKTGRQVSKTTTLVIQHLTQSVFIPGFNTLCVLPLEQQANRVGSMFIRPILRDSVIPQICPLTREQSTNISFKNNSNIVLSYAHLDAERTRGVPADKLHIDEAQDVNSKFLPVITSCLTGSKDWQYSVYTGTPKTNNNTLQFLWLSSSQAEWCIKCEACNHWNIPSIEFDLDGMIGPHREDISQESPATICSKCGKIIHPDSGQWVHRYDDRKWTYAGYHIPQIIMAQHYADPVNWSILLSKKEGGYQTTVTDFYREILGEACDIAARLVTLDDLLKVADLGDRKDFNRIRQMKDAYPIRVFGIDWGGGGEGGNYTTIALVCQTHSGVIEIPWATQLTTPHDHIKEAKEILKLANELNPHLIVHDYSGSGSLRETILVHSGYPIERIMPCRYVAGNQGVACRYVKETPWHPRPCYHIDPSRCLLLTCGAIKLKRIRFFNDDYKNEHDRGILRHFLALIDETSSSRGIESFHIVCEPGYRDEFAQASMLGCVGIWYKTNKWPKFSM